MPYWPHSNPTLREDFDPGEGQRECARAEHCSAPRFEDGGDGGKMVRLPAFTPRTFCDADRAIILDVIEDLPSLYVNLRMALPPSGAAAGPRVSGSKGRPLPLKGHVDALMRDLVNVVSSWEEVVRDIARLSQSTSGGRRDAVALAVGCATLAAHVDVLFALPPSPQTRFLSLNDAAQLPEGTRGIVHKSAEFAVAMQELDGAAAGLEMLRLHHRCRSVLGLTKRRDLVTVPCFQCGHAAIYRDETWDGLAEEAYCGNCGQSYTGPQWKLLQKLVYEEELQRQKVG